jgi:hypothetical protein
MKRTTKHGMTYMKLASKGARKVWKRQRRKALRHNDRAATREL